MILVIQTKLKRVDKGVGTCGVPVDPDANGLLGNIPELAISNAERRDDGLHGLFGSNIVFERNMLFEYNRVRESNFTLI
jgi:hypothetical protein